jgi:hypothetical protein
VSNHPAGPAFFWHRLDKDGDSFVNMHLTFCHALVSQDPDLSNKIWNTIATIKERDAFKSLQERYTR